jgi:hypothetical protein
VPSPLSAIRLLPAEPPTVTGVDALALDAPRRVRRAVAAALLALVVGLVALPSCLGEAERPAPERVTREEVAAAVAVVDPLVRAGLEVRAAVRAPAADRAAVARTLAMLPPSLRQAVATAIVVQAARADVDLHLRSTVDLPMTDR